MDQSRCGPLVDPELDRALSALLARTAREAIPPRLRELAQRLEAALRDAQWHRRNGGGTA